MKTWQVVGGGLALRKGDAVRVRRDPGDEWCEGYVELVGGTSVALVLSGGGMVRAGNGFIGGFLPLVVDGKNISGLMTGEEYQLEVWVDPAQRTGQPSQEPKCQQS